MTDGPSSHAVVTGDLVVLRPATVGDLDALAAIFAEPAVSRWWGQRSREELAERITGEHDGAARLVVLADGNVIGLIQYEEITDSDYRAASIDVALSSAWQGRGLGRDAVGALVRYLVEERGHHRLTIDPAVENAVAIRCYEAVGFTTVGVMRQYERRQDGRWHDGLLMELLAVDVGLTPRRDHGCNKAPAGTGPVDVGIPTR